MEKMNERSIEGNEFNGYEWSFRERGGFKDEYGGYKERKVVTGKRLVGYEVGDEQQQDENVERERRVVYGSERNELEMGMEIVAIQVQNFPDSISYQNISTLLHHSLDQT